MTSLFDQAGFDLRAMEAAAAVASAPEDKTLAAFQDNAILLYARADAEMIPRGDVSEILHEIALRNDIAARAGGTDSLQHLLSEAAQGRRALYRRGDDHREDFGSNGRTDGKRRQSGQGREDADWEQQDEQRWPQQSAIMWHGEVTPAKAGPT